MHFYGSSRLSITYPKLTILRIKRPLDYIKIFILLCLPFNAAQAGQISTIDFESGSTKAGEKLQNGFYWNVGKNTTVSSEKSKNGSYSLKFAYPAAKEGDDSFSEQRFTLGGYYPDLWIKYDIYIPSNYTHRSGPGSDNNKGFLHIWAGTYEGEGRGGPLYGPNFWPSSNGGSAVRFWIGSRINNVGQGIGHYGPTVKVIEPNDFGHWMTIVIHAKYASSSNDDGVYELWKTDWQGVKTKILDIHDGPFYATWPDGSIAKGFNQGYLLGWANSGFAEETKVYIDNIKFSTTSLLNDDSVANNLARPDPPTMIIN